MKMEESFGPKRSEAVLARHENGVPVYTLPPAGEPPRQNKVYHRNGWPFLRPLSSIAKVGLAPSVEDSYPSPATNETPSETLGKKYYIK